MKLRPAALAAALLATTLPLHAQDSDVRPTAPPAQGAATPAAAPAAKSLEDTARKAAEKVPELLQEAASKLPPELREQLGDKLPEKLPQNLDDAKALLPGLLDELRQRAAGSGLKNSDLSSVVAGINPADLLSAAQDPETQQKILAKVTTKARELGFTEADITAARLRLREEIGKYKDTARSALPASPEAATAAALKELESLKDQAAGALASEPSAAPANTPSASAPADKPADSGDGLSFLPDQPSVPASAPNGDGLVLVDTPSATPAAPVPGLPPELSALVPSLPTDPAQLAKLQKVLTDLDAQNARINFRKSMSLAQRRPELLALRARADQSRTDPEKRALMRQYYTSLFAEIVKSAPSLKEYAATQLPAYLAPLVDRKPR